MKIYYTKNVIFNISQIVSLRGVSIFEKKQELYMVMELMESDLNYLLRHSSQILSEAHIVCLMKQLLEGLKAIHSVGIVHRDLKPSNIFLNSDCQLRIGDFGLARYIGDTKQRGIIDTISERFFAEPMTEYVVTRWYRAPEVLLAPSVAYTEAIDLWSAGCIMAEMVTRKPFFPGKDYMNQVIQIFTVIGFDDVESLGFPLSAANATFLTSKCRFPKRPFKTIFPNLSEAVRDLNELLLSANPSQRPSAQIALTYPLFNDAEALFDYTGCDIAPPERSYFKFEKFSTDRSRLTNLIRADVASFNGCPSQQDRELDRSSHTNSGDYSPMSVEDVDDLDEFESILKNRSEKTADETETRSDTTERDPAASSHMISNSSFGSRCDNPFGKHNSSVAFRYRNNTHLSHHEDASKIADGIEGAATNKMMVAYAANMKRVSISEHDTRNTDSDFDLFLSSNPSTAVIAAVPVSVPVHTTSIQLKEGPFQRLLPASARYQASSAVIATEKKPSQHALPTIEPIRKEREREKSKEKERGKEKEAEPVRIRSAPSRPLLSSIQRLLPSIFIANKAN